MKIRTVSQHTFYLLLKRIKQLSASISTPTPRDPDSARRCIGTDAPSGQTLHRGRHFSTSTLYLLVTTLLVFSAFQLAQAQKDDMTWKGVTYINDPSTAINYFPDSIRIEYPTHKAVIVLEMKNVTKDLSQIAQFADSLKSWLRVIEKSSSNIGSPHRVEIRTRDKRRTEIIITEPLEKVTRVMLKEKTVTALLPPGWEITIWNKDYKAYVYAQDFTGLVQAIEPGLGPAIEKIVAERKEHGHIRNALKSKVILQDNKVVYSEMKYLTSLDFIELNATSGLGFAGDKFYPELNGEVSLRFSDRYYRMNHKVTFSYNNLFIMESRPEGGYTVNPNSFVSVSWHKNLVFKGKEPSWLGFGAGYLVTRNGNYFTGNTMKFFISKDVGNVKIIPELYLTDDYKKSIVGIKFNFTF